MSKVFIIMGIIAFLYISIFALLKAASDFDDEAESMYERKNSES